MTNKTLRDDTNNTFGKKMGKSNKTVEHRLGTPEHKWMYQFEFYDAVFRTCSPGADEPGGGGADARVYNAHALRRIVLAHKHLAASKTLWKLCSRDGVWNNDKVEAIFFPVSLSLDVGFAIMLALYWSGQRGVLAPMFARALRALRQRLATLRLFANDAQALIDLGEEEFRRQFPFLHRAAQRSVNQRGITYVAEFVANNVGVLLNRISDKLDRIEIKCGPQLKRLEALELVDPAQLCAAVRTARSLPAKLKLLSKRLAALMSFGLLAAEDIAALASEVEAVQAAHQRSSLQRAAPTASQRKRSNRYGDCLLTWYHKNNLLAWLKLAVIAATVQLSNADIERVFSKLKAWFDGNRRLLDDWPHLALLHHYRHYGHYRLVLVDVPDVKYPRVDFDYEQ